MTRQRLHGHGRPVLFSLIGIAGYVRGGDVAKVYQMSIYLGLVAPGVQHQRPQLGTRMDEGLLIHHLSAGRVDENGSRPNLLEKLFPGHAAGAFVQGDMQRHHRSLLQEFLQGNKAVGPFSLCAGRVAQEDLQAQGTGHILHLFAHMAHAHDANHRLVQLDGPAGRNSIQGGKYIVCHGGGIAPLRILNLDSMGLAPGYIHMVKADGGAGNQLHPRTFQRLLIALGTGTDYDGIGIHHGIAVNGPPVQIDNLCVRFQDTLQKGDIGICYNFHLYHTNISIFCNLCYFL